MAWSSVYLSRRSAVLREKNLNTVLRQLKTEKAGSRVVLAVCLFHYYRLVPPAEKIIAVNGCRREDCEGDRIS